MRPSYILGRLKVAVTQPRELRRLLMGGRTFLKYIFDIDFWKKSAAAKQVKDEKNIAVDQTEAKEEATEGSPEGKKESSEAVSEPIFKITQ